MEIAWPYKEEVEGQGRNCLGWQEWRLQGILEGLQGPLTILPTAAHPLSSPTEGFLVSAL